MAGLSVAIVAPGEMGHAVGARLREHGVRVTTCLAGRSERSHARARTAGMDVVDDDETLVRTAGLFLSIVPPGTAAATGERIARALERTGARLVYVECNAIAPATVEAIGQRLAAAGAGFVDAGIVGGPPRPATPGPRFYASGPDVSAFLPLRARGLDIRTLGPAVGQASALKMCYAALTKGLTALGAELLVAARLSGISEPLAAELGESQPALLQWLDRQLPAMPPKAYRWVAEMEEIARTFVSHGLPEGAPAGAARFYALVARSPAAAPHPDERRPARTRDDLVAALADACPGHTRV